MSRLMQVHNMVKFEARQNEGDIAVYPSGYIVLKWHIY